MALAMRFGNAISVAQGAQTSVYLASAPEVTSQSGLYFDEGKAVKSNHASYDRHAQEKLWGISAKMVSL
jgi:hypothetical protein